ncbi:MAG TPA: cytochrome b/b6 domain-containing protein [Bauldia sp.]|nr:cytochrome b/b6 domain-containing protein [Bauldia sp.]
MFLRGTSRRYGSVAMGFHWLTVVLVGAAYLLAVEGPSSRVFSPEMDGPRALHETLGVLVLLVTVLRLLWRLADRVPEEPPMPGWMRLAARAGHGILYLLLLAIPGVAILASWFGAHPVTLLAIGDVGPLLAENAPLGANLFEVHGLLGEAIVWVAGLHAAAALLHHFWLRDRVLRSMLPGAET